jgi:capsular polysaccharide transport system permease protein
LTHGSAGSAAGHLQADPSDRVLLHADIIVSLMRRDLQSRFGHNALGYSWTFVAPLAWFGAIYFTFWFAGRSSPVYTDIITFIMSGLIPYAAFRYVIASIGRSAGQVRGLLIFPNVTGNHAVISSAILEWINIFVVYAVLAVGNYLAYGNFELANPLQFIAGVGLAWALGAGYGYLFIVLWRINPTFYDFGYILLRPAIFLSAIFFVANEVPANILKYISWNPLLHAIEYSRDGLLFHYDSKVASPAYVLLWIAGFIIIGTAIDLLRRR